ncbi:MAG: hypothetical protein ACM3ZB_17055 [bacterium]
MNTETLDDDTADAVDDDVVLLVDELLNRVSALRSADVPELEVRPEPAPAIAVVELEEDDELLELDTADEERADAEEVPPPR